MMAEVITALIVSLTTMCGLVVWVVKHIVGKSDSNIEQLISLLKQSVDEFSEFKDAEDVTHSQLVITQNTLVTTQNNIIKELERLTSAVDRLTDRLDGGMLNRRRDGD